MEPESLRYRRQPTAAARRPDYHTETIESRPPDFSVSERSAERPTLADRKFKFKSTDSDIVVGRSIERTARPADRPRNASLWTNSARRSSGGVNRTVGPCRPELSMCRPRRHISPGACRPWQLGSDRGDAAGGGALQRVPFQAFGACRVWRSELRCDGHHQTPADLPLPCGCPIERRFSPSLVTPTSAAPWRRGTSDRVDRSLGASHHNVSLWARISRRRDRCGRPGQSGAAV
jgi:hypothetical protein